MANSLTFLMMVSVYLHGSILNVHAKPEKIQAEMQLAFKSVS